MKKLTIGIACAALVVAGDAATARADDRAACQSAWEGYQVHLNAHRLLEAKKALLTCARSECGATIAADCEASLATTNDLVPTIVFVAKDPSGADLVDVKVSMDGAVVATSLNGEAVAVDPGPHTFEFESATGEKRQQQTIVREKEKAREVGVTFGAPAPASAQVQPAPAEAARPAADSTNASGSAMSTPPSDDTRPGAGSGQRTAGVVVAGLGLASVGAGVVVALLAKSAYDGAKADHCASGACDPTGKSDTDSARSLGNVGTALVAAGGVAAAAGLVLWLTAPKASPSSPSSPAAQLVPAVGPRGAQLTWRRTF